MPNVQTQTLDAAGPIFSFILGGIAPVTDCHLAQVKKLLEGGADVEETTWQGESALLYAVHRNNLALVTLLLDYGASIDRRTNFFIRMGGDPNGLFDLTVGVLESTQLWSSCPQISRPRPPRPQSPRDARGSQVWAPRVARFLI